MKTIRKSNNTNNKASARRGDSTHHKYINGLGISVQSRFISILFIAMFLGLALFAGSAAAATRDVGTGYQYSTISAAITAASDGDTIYVHSGEYVVSSSIQVIKNNLIIRGDGINNTIVKASTPTVIGTYANPAIFNINGVTGTEIYGMTLHGNGGSLAIMHDISNSWRDFCSGIKVSSSSETKIHDIYFTLTYGDSIRTGSGNTNTLIYNCIFDTPGHDGVSMWYGSGWRMTNCIVNTFINAGMRIENIVNGAEVDHCTFYSNTDSGSGGIELLRLVGTGVNIHHNVFRDMHNTNGYGIFFFDATSGSITIANNIFYDCPGGYITAGSGSIPAYTNTGNQLGASSSTDWAAAGYGYDASNTTPSVSQPVYNGSVPVTLTSPAAGWSGNTTNGNISFEWLNVNSTNYRLVVANNPVFNASTEVYNQTTRNDPTSVALGNGTYYWKVAPYVDSTGAWASFTANRSFTVTGNAVGIETSGTYGVVYAADTLTPIKSAVVTIGNDSWSGTYVTSDSGAYGFNVNSGTGDYWVIAAATDYQTSAVMKINSTVGAYKKLDVAMVKNPSYFQPNYVKLICRSLFGTRYTNVAVSAYLDSVGTTGSPVATGKTDDHGEVTLKLDANERYAVKFVDASQGIDTVFYISGSTSSQSCIVWFAHKTPDAITNNSEPIKVNESAHIWWRVYNSTPVNTSYGYLNQSILSLDGTGITWSTNIYSTNSNGTANGIYSYTDSGAGNSTLAIIVPNNATYMVKSTITHPSLGTVYKQAFIEIRGTGIRPGYDFGWEDQWNYEAFGIILLFLMGGLFGAGNAKVGALLVVLLGNFCIYVGWFHLDTGELLMSTFGTLLVVVYILSARE
jgi:hypothetical protein